MRQAKNFTKKPSPIITGDLLNQDREILRMVVDFITRHCRLNKYMQSIGLAKDADKIVEHVLRKCESLRKLRCILQGEEMSSAESYSVEAKNPNNIR